MPVTKDQVIEQLVAVCEANPGAYNPRDPEEGFASVCLYHNNGVDDEGEETCLGGRIVVDLGFPSEGLTEGRSIRTLVNLPNLARQPGTDDFYSDGWATVDAGRLLQKVQEKADTNVEWATVLSYCQTEGLI